MELWKVVLALVLAATMFAQQPPAPQVPDPSAATTPKPKKAKKKSHKKWIVIGAVAAGAVVALLLVNKRLDNEGAGIFHAVGAAPQVNDAIPEARDRVRPVAAAEQ